MLSTELSIRRASVDDAPGLHSLLKSLLSEDKPWTREFTRHLGKEEEWIQSWLKDDRQHQKDGGKFLFFAFQENMLVGLVNGMSWCKASREVFERTVRELGLDEKRPGQVGIMVHKEYRRLGIGTKLLERASEELREMSATIVIASVHVENKPSLSFFNKIGFIHFKSEGKYSMLRKHLA